MSNARKLQTEIDRVLKKVDEGVILFDEIWEKVYSAEQQNQKEKYEADLKKEIKKLQRLRDQIKTWIGSSDVKDKDTLVDARKLIETKMEQFKICEKETKTKTYSKEGLARAERLDPAEQAKVDCCKWVQEVIDQLNELVEEKDLEVDTLSAGKGKKTNKHKIEDLNVIISNHKYHISKLEGINRLIMNDRVPVDNVEAIKEDLEYYLEANEDEDYLMSYDEEYFYEPVGLDDLDVVNVDRVTQAATSGKKSKEDDASTTTSGSKRRDKASKKSTAASSSGMIPLTIGRARVASSGEKEKKTPSKMERTSSSASSGSGPLGPTPKPAPAPAPSGGASMAAILKRETEQQEKEKQKALAAQQQQQRLLQEQQQKQQAELLRQQQLQRQQQEEAQQKAQQQQAELLKLQQEQQRQQQEAAAKQQAQLLQQQQQQAQLQAQLQEQQQQQLASQTASSGQSVGSASGGLDGLLGSGSGLGGLPLGSAESGGSVGGGANGLPIGSGTVISGPAVGGANTGDATERYLGGLNESFLHMPSSADSERQRTYTPRNPYPTPSSYPTTPAPVFENQAFYNKVGMDCLFFIFYYSQGTYQQYLAAKELKKQSWRFHKKYSTWFQRHEEPKMTTDEFEEGTYVYFDYETGWGQRIKSDFRFEYSFLEDSLQ
mmetsp:Transcript_8149/g.17031  ORF Transcript_8149/g.17031 Transcript_8149/m.17031 type:complete len:660 (-) Transcript_8149:194-2173(-)